jgi:hypothetical protein
MTGPSEKDAARDEDQMEDQEAFRDDPRGKQQVSEQRPETQADDEGDETTGGEEGEADRGDRDQTGRDDPGEATGNPPSAG